jgi:KUP system potassium uptake protein
VSQSKPNQGLILPGLGALGIVYGDLGTSPLYTFQTVVGDAGGKISPEVALGSLSLIVWALIVTISIKYCLVVMRADNQGEGGILALMSLLRPSGKPGLLHRGGLLIAAGLFGAALIYGDGIITPAISVLSAVEGLNVATDAFKPYVLPLAVAILIGLFVAQPLGTARLGKLFGPIMLVWFAVIGAIGAIAIARFPGVLAAISPLYGARFLIHHGWGSFVVLGGVFLALTGGEALYADMGHLGRRPVRFAWTGIVLPGLLLNYAGQAAQILRDPKLADNPFFSEVPHWGIYPLVALATVATIIASQAIITGAYSLTRQAMQLGWMPGLVIRQTSDEEYGQIYVPLVNWIMMVATIAITIGFGSSAKLAGAFGTAVSTTMLLTTVLLYDVMRHRWGWGMLRAGAIAGLFLAVDLAFICANLLKILDGGYVPLLFGLVLFVIMITWHRGIALMRAGFGAVAAKCERLLDELRAGRLPRVPGHAVFLSPGAADDEPPHRPVRRPAGAPGDPVREVRHRAAAGSGRRARQRPAGDGRVLVRRGQVRLRRDPQPAGDAGCRPGAGLRHRSGQGHVLRRPRRRGQKRHPAQDVRVGTPAVRVPVPQRGSHVGPLRPAAGPISRNRPPGGAMMPG